MADGFAEDPDVEELMADGREDVPRLPAPGDARVAGLFVESSTLAFVVGNDSYACVPISAGYGGLLIAIPTALWIPTSWLRSSREDTKDL